MKKPYNIITFINQWVILPESAVADLLKLCKEIEVPKNHFLLKQGSVSHHLWYIVKGSVRSHYGYKDKEVTSWIYNENQMVTAFGSVFNRSPSYENLQCTEDSVFVQLNYVQLQELYLKHPKLAKFGRLWLEEMLTVLDQFYKGFMFMTAKEKYDLLLAVFPDVTQRVNLGHIASFLGISQETLSRIRRQN